MSPYTESWYRWNMPSLFPHCGHICPMSTTLHLFTLDFVWLDFTWALSHHLLWWGYLMTGNSALSHLFCFWTFFRWVLPDGSVLSDRNVSALSYKDLFEYSNSKIVGSCLYLVRIEQLVFPSRFIVGIGASSVGLFLADTNRVTRNNNKTTVISALLMCSTVRLIMP